VNSFGLEGFGISFFGGGGGLNFGTELDGLDTDRGDVGGGGGAGRNRLEAGVGAGVGC